MERINPTCGHCGAGTVTEGLSSNGSILYKCTRTGCRCMVAVSRTGTTTEQPCLAKYSEGSCAHSKQQEAT